MTQNLRIQNKTVYSTDSDIESGSFNIPGDSGIDDHITVPGTMFYSLTNTTYYDWLAATANTGINTGPNGNASGSVCAKSWHLPSKLEYDNLSSYYNNNTIRQSPANFGLTGFGHGTTVNIISNGNKGYFGTSTCISNCNTTGVNAKIYAFCIGSDTYYNVCSSYGTGWNYGGWGPAIRCIANS